MTTFFDAFDRTSENDLVNLYLTPKQPQIPPTAQLKNDTQFYDRFYFEKFYATYTNIALVVVFFAFIICVIGSNLLVIHGILDMQRRIYSDFYMMSLAFIDAFVGVGVIPFMCLVHLQGYFPLGSRVCNIWIFMDYFTILATSWNYAGLMFQYLWMIVWPTNYKTGTTERHFYIHIWIIAICYFLAMISWVPIFVRLNDDNDIRGVCGYSVIDHPIFSVYMGVLGMYIPALICIVSALWCGYHYYVYRTTNRIFLSDLVPQGQHMPIFLVKVVPLEKELVVDHMDVAGLHLPSTLFLLFIFLASRSSFYIYFGTGSFIPNFFPPDLSNEVYWIMHSNALAAPLLHMILDSELRQSIQRLLRLKKIQPRVQPSATLPS